MHLCRVFRIPLLLACVLLLAAGAACNRKTAAKSGPFPASNEVSGWAKTGETRTFDAANLWRYIDGDAEKYLKAGAQSASTADYKYQDKVEAVVDVYTMSERRRRRRISSKRSRHETPSRPRWAIARGSMGKA